MLVKLHCSVCGWFIDEALGCSVAWYEWRSPGNTRHSILIFKKLLFVLFELF